MVPRYPHDTKCEVEGDNEFWGLESAQSKERDECLKKCYET